MSYPKEKCDKQCPYCEYDPDYKTTVCGYTMDIDDAMVDITVPRYCPWLCMVD